MSPPKRPRVTPKITLSDGSIFELLPDESVSEALARAEDLRAQGLSPANVKAADVAGQPKTTSLSYDDDEHAKIAEAFDREKAGEASESDKILLDVARGKGGTDGATIKSKFVAAALCNFIGRVENINAEIKDRQWDRKEIYTEVKIFGFDVPTVKRVVRLRQIERALREEQAALDQIYLEATEGEDGSDIPLPSLPEAKKARRKSQARLKKDKARDAMEADARAAREAVAARVEAVSKSGLGSHKGGAR
ncbi:uncharacterized protein (UPF0335 family) [Litorimonas taeanensis]|uniref:Uncharacterized protein (UPF0335 family) n=1 Tax=Litorimonas taeanensis TaxID=568099 RepID=A0A420WDC4_9PROT|nr:GapR family DNA-binding domain-containing protein [Litorimonas taeanensis]RKQ68978.1 uncharacterized protein (UPF0335 family) [Litorimonas taeanensis]